jgi:hypothetical protein
MTVHFAFRRSMTIADKAMVQKALKTLKICDARDELCLARRASGFLPNG